MQFENLFDLKEAKKTNLLISGANASGKTRLACAISSMLNRLGYKVVVIDVSGIWKTISDLPFVVKAYKFDGEISIPKRPYESHIVDLSMLKLSETKEIVEQISNEIWESRQNQPNQKPMWLIFEEAEIYLRNIRGSASESVYRMVHVARNIGVRCVLLSVDLALLDASVIRQCGIRYHGFLNVEQNSKRKFTSYYGKDYTRIAFEDLEAGDFIRLHKRKLDIVSVPLFEPKHKPQAVYQFEQEPQATIPEPKRKSFIKRLLNL